MALQCEISIHVYLVTVVGQLPETNLIQNAPNQKSIIDHTLGNILDNDFQKFSVEVKSMI